MKNTHKNEHQDVITIIASSDQSFDDAVAKGIRQLKDPDGPHKNLDLMRSLNFKEQSLIKEIHVSLNSIRL